MRPAPLEKKAGQWLKASRLGCPTSPPSEAAGFITCGEAWADRQKTRGHCCFMTKSHRHGSSVSVSSVQVFRFLKDLEGCFMTEFMQQSSGCINFLHSVLLCIHLANWAGTEMMEWRVFFTSVLPIIHAVVFSHWIVGSTGAELRLKAFLVHLILEDVEVVGGGYSNDVLVWVPCCVKDLFAKVQAVHADLILTAFSTHTHLDVTDEVREEKCCFVFLETVPF